MMIPQPHRQGPRPPGTPVKAERNAALVARRKAGARQLDLAREFGLCESRVRQLLATAAKRGLLVLPLLAPAKAPAHAHDLFANLRSPKGELCCGLIDCKPVAECVLPGGRQGLQIEGVCTPIPPGTTLGMAAPDGVPHACWGHTGGVPFIRCAILPGDV